MPEVTVSYPDPETGEPVQEILELTESELLAFLRALAEQKD